MIYFPKLGFASSFSFTSLPAQPASSGVHLQTPALSQRERPARLGASRGAEGSASLTGSADGYSCADTIYGNISAPASRNFSGLHEVNACILWKTICRTARTESQCTKLRSAGIAAQQRRSCSQVLPLMVEKVEPNFVKWVFAMVIITNECQLLLKNNRRAAERHKHAVLCKKHCTAVRGHGFQRCTAP